jgi:hypothetical protein
MNKTYSFTINGAQIIFATLLIIFLVNEDYRNARNVALVWAAYEIVGFLARKLTQKLIERLKLRK